MQKISRICTFSVLKIGYLVIISLLISGCAQMVNPTGGAKDITPPKALKMIPLNNSVGFKTGEKIKISFDEFMDIANANDKVMVSPPLKTAPSFKVSGKNLWIEFSDTLKENATYTLFFDNCIRDITENNPIPSFEYNFSTGSFIDSGKIAGTVVNALTLKPEKQVYVMLYRKNVDSLPMTEKPYYITKTNDLGAFSFAHLGSDKYKLFALNDKNNNLIFDQFSESIGFLPSQIESNDAKEHVVHLFSQDDTLQRVLKTTVLDKGMVMIALKISAINTKFVLKNGVFEDRFIRENSVQMDSVFLYDKKGLNDTTTIYISDNNMSDTLEISPSGVQKSNRKRGQNPHITISTSQDKELFKPLLVVFNRPIKYFIPEKVKLLKLEKDTISVPFKLIKQDSISKHFILDFEKEEQKKYSLFIDDSAFIGYNEQANDSLKSQFVILTENDYGNLKINLQNPKNQKLIVQLLDNQQNVVQSEILTQDKVIFWKNILPGTFQLQAVIDENNNNKWDSGNYYKKLLPEKIIIFSTPIVIRSKWDIEEKFIIN